MNQINKYLKLLALTAGFFYFVYYSGSKIEWHFIDNVNLIIHESGHVIFMILGTTFHLIGGSLLQVIVPLLFLFYFVIRQQYSAAAVMGFWAAINLVNVSVYAGDALKMQLPLLTGGTDSHDWNQLLFHWNLLHHTQLVTSIIYSSAWIVAILSLALGVIPVIRDIQANKVGIHEQE